MTDGVVAQDPLLVLQEPVHGGKHTICTDQDSYAKDTLEQQWNRITSLQVTLQDSADDILTAIPSNDKTAYDFYATAIHLTGVAARRKVATETVLSEAALLVIVAFAWCIGQRWVHLRK
jgi:hypothetical protein